jgi:hypothetical protein
MFSTNSPTIFTKAPQLANTFEQIKNVYWLEGIKMNNYSSIISFSKSVTSIFSLCINLSCHGAKCKINTITLQTHDCCGKFFSKSTYRIAKTPPFSKSLGGDEEETTTCSNDNLKID